MAVGTPLLPKRAAMRLVCRWVMLVALMLCARVASAQSPLLAPPVTSPAQPLTAQPPATPATMAPSSPPATLPMSTAAAPTPAPSPVAASATPPIPKSDPVLSKFLTEPLPVPKSADAAKGADDKGDGEPQEEPSWYERAFLLVPAPWDS